MVRIARSFAVVVVVASIGLIASLAGTSFAESSASHVAKKKAAIATLAVEKPNVSVKKKGSDTFVSATDGEKLHEGDTVQTDATGRATVNYTDSAYTRLDVNTTFTIEKLTEDKGARQIKGSLDTGRTWNRTEALTESGSFEQSGAGATAAVAGTAFSMECHLVPNVDPSAVPEQECSFLGVYHQIVLRSTNGEVRDIPEFGLCTSTQPTETSPGNLCEVVHQLTPDEVAAIAWVQENLFLDLTKFGFAPGPIAVTVQGTLQVENGQIVSFTPTSAPVTTTTTTTTTTSSSGGGSTPTPPPAPVIDATNPVGLAPCSTSVCPPTSTSLPAGFTPSPEITAEDDQPVTFVVNVTDPSGLPMTVQFTDLPDNGVICAPSTDEASMASFPCEGTGAFYATVVGYQAITTDPGNTYQPTTSFAADTVFVFAPNDYEGESPASSSTTVKVTNNGGTSATKLVDVTVTEDPCEFGCGSSASSSTTPSPSVTDPPATDPSSADTTPTTSADAPPTTSADTTLPKPDDTNTNTNQSGSDG